MRLSSSKASDIGVRRDWKSGLISSVHGLVMNDKRHVNPIGAWPTVPTLSAPHAPVAETQASRHFGFLFCLRYLRSVAWKSQGFPFLDGGVEPRRGDPNTNGRRTPNSVGTLYQPYFYNDEALAYSHAFSFFCKPQTPCARVAASGFLIDTTFSCRVCVRYNIMC
ncbi:uncharacterized protein CC84DRAFT_290916 [Paraphaeosphaeria sporulosa]|uniref:Uncharacterized protein n=1 Tax=Paraphaeosphaeria sporulosa TaxID=1460663 RepID=A0A177C0Y8_9PLEO|nr:uncharacterized protein CC84DRAFT_290916 [Paraphaeosphaeria sporulosa]OAG00280.1 hypothetical protein CC84DRAFT_290916 [Paraphaeosphaeria sporulosa]